MPIVPLLRRNSQALNATEVFAVHRHAAGSTEARLVPVVRNRRARSGADDSWSAACRKPRTRRFRNHRSAGLQQPTELGADVFGMITPVGRRRRDPQCGRNRRLASPLSLIFGSNPGVQLCWQLPRTQGRPPGASRNAGVVKLPRRVPSMRSGCAELLPAF